jgi:hypothetical protein
MPGNDRSTFALPSPKPARDWGSGKRKGPRPKPETFSFIHFGGGKGIRTPDLLHAMQTRYQLRHTPK